MSNRLQKTIIFLFIFNFLMLFCFPAAAQEPVITPEPGAVTNGPTIEPSILETAQAAQDAWIREFESLSVFDFRIAYLIAADAVPGSDLMTEEMFTSHLGAQIFHSWEDFEVQNEATPYQIILIHDSVYPEVDFEWTQKAYRNRVMLAGIGMPFAHLVEITGDRCAEETNPQYAAYFEKTVLLFSYVVSLANGEDQSPIDQHLLEDCDEKYDLTSAGIFQSVTNFPLENVEFLFSFRDVLVGKSMYYNFHL